MKQFVKKNNGQYTVSEGIFDIIKAVVSGNVEVDDIDVDKLKKTIKNAEKIVEKEAKKKGMTVDQLIKSKGYTF